MASVSDFHNIALNSKEFAALKTIVEQEEIDPELCKMYPQFIELGFVKRKEIAVYRGTAPFGAYYKTDRARRYIEYIRSKRKSEKRDALRYWITTIIALAALAKSFWPEIIAIAETLLKRLMR